MTAARSVAAADGSALTDPSASADGSATHGRPGAAVLDVRGLTVSYRGGGRPVDAVREVSFSVAPGEIFGLVGESGSGKSSVCGALMRLLPTSAAVRADAMRFDGSDLLALPERAMREIRGRRIGFVPQQPMSSLSPTTPVGRQLQWYFGQAWDTEEVRATLRSIGLQVMLDRPAALPGAFSGGQLQRMLIAAATLAHRPALLIADEPTTTLDATVQAQVLRLLLDLRARLGLSVLYISHDLAVIAQMCDRVGVMYGGRLVEIAPVVDLFAAPRHPYTRALLAAMPSARTSGHRLQAIGGSAAGANRLDGCPFAPRCPVAEPVCSTTMPPPVSVGGSMVRCHVAGRAR